MQSSEEDNEYKGISKYIPEKKQLKKQSVLSLEIQDKAEQIEKQNYLLIQKAKNELKKSSKKQKETTKELKRQGEKLSSAKEAAIQTHSNVKKGEKITDQIKQEGNLVFTKKSIFSKFLDFFSSEKKAEKKLEEELKRKIEINSLSTETMQSGEIEYGSSDEEIKGEAKTNREVLEISKILKGMKKEAEIQNQETKKQMGK